jgi:hypothetical protein
MVRQGQVGLPQTPTPPKTPTIGPGNTSALTNFNASNLVGLAVTLTASKIPFVKRLGQTLGDAASQAVGLAQQAQGGCQ